MQFKINNAIEEQSYIGDYSKKFITSKLDSQRRRKILINDMALRDHNTLFQRQYRNTNRKDVWSTTKPLNDKWQPIYAYYFASVSALSDSNNYFEAYKNKLKFIKTLDQKFQIITAVKYNLPSFLQTLLNEKTQNINNWPDIDQKAFYLSFENPSFYECAILFINHLATDKCDVLLTAINGKPSPAHYVEQHNKFDVQHAFLKKMLIFYLSKKSSDYDPISHIYVNLIYLAINLRMPNGLRNYLTYACKNISSTHLNINLLFAYALLKNYTEGICIFIEQIPACLNDLSGDLLDKVCRILIREINNANDIHTLERLFIIFKIFNKNSSDSKGKSLNYSFVSLAMALKVLDVAANFKLEEQKLNEIISEIHFEYNLLIIGKYVKQKFADSLIYLNKHDGQKHSKSVSKSNIFFDIESALQSNNDAEYKRLATIYPLHSIVVVNKNLEDTYQMLIKNNKHDYVIYILSMLVKLFNNKEASIISLTFELNFMEILKYYFEKYGANDFLKLDIKITMERAVKLNQGEAVNFYINLLCNHKSLTSIDKEIFYTFLGNSIVSAKNISTLHDIYNNIITIYKPLLPYDQNQLYTTEHFVNAFIGQLQERALHILDVTKLDELKMLATILSTPQEKTHYFYKALLKKINHDNLLKPEISYAYLQEWLNILMARDLLNDNDLRQAKIIRLVIIEKYMQINQSKVGSRIDVCSDFPSTLKLKLKSSKLIITISDTILTKKLKNYINSITTLNTYESNVDHYDYQFLEHMINDSSYHFVKMLISLVNSYNKAQLYLLDDQKELCFKIINSLYKGIKIHQYYSVLLKSALPILVRYKSDYIFEIVNIITSSRCSNISPPQISNEFDPNLLSLYSADFLSSLRLDVFPNTQATLFQPVNISYPISGTNGLNQYSSKLDGLILKSLPSNGEEKRKLLFSIIHHLEKQTSVNINLTAVEYGVEYLLLETKLPDIIKCIESLIHELSAQAIQSSYCISEINIDESQSDMFWCDSYRNNFGIPPINITQDKHFYQKLYKLTHLEFLLTDSFNARFDYCLNHELIFAMHRMVKNVPTLMSTIQLRNVLTIAAKLRCYETIPLLLNYISPFDMFTVFDASSNSAWDHINKAPDKEYMPLAKLILTKIKEYIGDEGTNLIILAITFGMGRLALNLLESTKSSLSVNDIKAVFINAIHYREYDIVSFMLSTFNKQHPTVFNTDLDDFYTYLCDEINLVDCMSNLKKIENKLHAVYKDIFSLDNKSSFFNSQNAIWLLCVEAVDSRRKFLEEQYLANKNGLVRH